MYDIKKYKDLYFKKPFHIITAGFNLGIYVLLFYLSNNITLIQSIQQIIILAIFLITTSTAILLLINRIFSRAEDDPLSNRATCIGILTLFVLFLFPAIKEISVFYSVPFFFSILAFLFYFRLHFGVLSIGLSFMIIPTVCNLFIQSYNMYTYSEEWAELDFNTKDISIKKPVNIYLIQPDSYVNFSEFPRGHYDYDNSNMDNWLKSKNFRLYSHFRSNYGDTITSNLSLFTLKHHYYHGHSSSGEVFYGRQIVAGQNKVIDFFKRNNYQTYFLNLTDYITRDGCFYDYCHRLPNLFSLFPDHSKSNTEIIKNWEEDLLRIVKNKTNERKFVFIENTASPSHIAYRTAESKGVEIERLEYLEQVKEANIWLKRIVDNIIIHDPQALVAILSDHGAYVGFESVRDSLYLTTDEDLIKSCFSSYLAIRWPDDYDGTFDQSFATSVNFFRYILSYLTEDSRWTNKKEADHSYLVAIKPQYGVYKVIDENYLVTNMLHSEF